MGAIISHTVIPPFCQYCIQKASSWVWMPSTSASIVCPISRSNNWKFSIFNGIQWLKSFFQSCVELSYVTNDKVHWKQPNDASQQNYNRMAASTSEQRESESSMRVKPYQDPDPYITHTEVAHVKWRHRHGNNGRCVAEKKEKNDHYNVLLSQPERESVSCSVSEHVTHVCVLRSNHWRGTNCYIENIPQPPQIHFQCNVSVMLAGSESAIFSYRSLAGRKWVVRAACRQYRN